MIYEGIQKYQLCTFAITNNGTQSVINVFLMYNSKNLFQQSTVCLIKVCWEYLNKVFEIKLYI